MDIKDAYTDLKKPPFRNPVSRLSEIFEPWLRNIGAMLIQF
ncbi:hypothetical protein [Spirochaeta dissipatitropha]